MTLDQANVDFETSPSFKTCAKLLRVVTQYHDDSMVGNETLRSTVQRVARWLEAHYA